MKKFNRVGSFVALVALVLVSACGGGTTPTAPSTPIVIPPPVTLPPPTPPPSAADSISIVSSVPASSVSVGGGITFNLSYTNTHDMVQVKACPSVDGLGCVPADEIADSPVGTGSGMVQAAVRVKAPFVSEWVILRFTPVGGDSTLYRAVVARKYVAS